MTDGIVYVKGRKIDQAKVRAFLKTVDYDDFEQDDGTWMSPVSGEIFATRFAMVGSIGTYLRPVTDKDPSEPTRAGYRRAKTAGREPTSEQRAANARYMKARRKGTPRHAEVVSERIEAIEQQPGKEASKAAAKIAKAKRMEDRRFISDELQDEIDAREAKSAADAAEAMDIVAEWAAVVPEESLDNEGGL